MKRIKYQKPLARRSQSKIFGSIVSCMIFMWLVASCVEVEKGTYAIDNVPPGQVSEVDVVNVPGGAVITYRLPDDEDLLYVKVVYRMSDGTPAEQKSSAYTSKITVEGLGRAQPQTVQLICGDKSGNESAPYEKEIEPLDAPIYQIQESLQMTEDFGGVQFSWDNPLRENIVLTIYILDEHNKFLELGNVYSSASEGQFNLRGYLPEEMTLVVSMRDRWKNKTELKQGTFIPLLEEKLDRLLFQRWNPPGIPYSVYGAFHIEALWNGITAEIGYLTSNTIILPISITFDMGQTAKLNRIKIWQRLSANNLIFASQNVRKFTLWGSSHDQVDEDFDKWLFLGNFESVKPSGLPLGQLTDEDIAFAFAGEDYIVQANRDKPVRYIRLHILECWAGIPAAMGEIEFFGDIQK